MSAWQRDPVSVLFDSGARRLLARAYARPGTWVGTRLADPTPRHLGWLRRRGIEWNGPDNVTATGGSGIDARTRWARGFIRAVYYQHKWYSAPAGGGPGWRTERRTTPRDAGGLQIQVGRRLPGAGPVPPGRAVRIRVLRGGRAKERAVEAIPSSRRWAEGRKGNRTAGPRWADPAARDW